MPVPIAAVLAQVVGTAIGGALGSGTNLATSNLSRWSTYSANWFNPNSFPEYNDLVRLFYNGVINFDQLKDLLAYQGVSLNLEGQNVHNAVWWRNVVHNNRPRISYEVARRAYRLGDIDYAGVRDIVAHMGIADKNLADLILKDNPPLSPNDVLALLRREDINKFQADQLLEHAGFQNTEILDYVYKDRQCPSIGEIITLQQRGEITAEQASKWLDWFGRIDDSVKSATISAADPLPTVSTLLDWETRHVWDNDVTALYDLDEEKSDNYVNLMRKNAWNKVEVYTDENGQAINGLQYTDLFHRAKWNLLSVSQAVELFHRLRPTGGVANGPRVPGVRSFTANDLETVFKTQNVPPGIRQQLKSITYSLPSRLVLKRLFASQLIDKQEVNERYQDMGYSPRDSELLAEQTEHDVIQSRVDKLSSTQRSQIIDAYKIGTLTRDDAKIQLATLYYHDYQLVSDYLALPRADQIRLANESQFVNLTLNNVDIAWDTSLVKQSISAIRSAYLRVEINTQQATQDLLQLGITQQRATQYVSRWYEQFVGKGREVSASQIVAWYVEGILPPNVVTLRLLALGYNNVDIQAMLLSAQIKIAKNAQRVLAANAKVQKQAAQQLIAQAKAAQQAQAKARATLARSASKSQLLKWLEKGYVSAAGTYKRLIALGTLPLDAQAFIQDALTTAAGKAAKNAAKQSASAHPVPSSNGSAKTAT